MKNRNIKTESRSFVGSHRKFGTLAKISVILLSLIVLSCNGDKMNFDASGSFEAEEVIISSQASGTIEQFNLEEGEELKEGQFIGYVDSTQLYLTKKQLEAQVDAILSKRPNQSAQLAALQAQLATAEKEQRRVSNLVKSDAATTKQLDDINGSVSVIKKQIDAQQSTLQISTTGINKEAGALNAQIALLDDALERCKIINPVRGTVLTKYAEAKEVAAPGKPLYKVADLTTIILRVYITSNQLPVVKLNQSVTVFTDDGQGGFKETKGTITWINDKAEFTPKTIQTKDERANLVYAVKVKVPNDGTFKIGMYGEIKW